MREGFASFPSAFLTADVVVIGAADTDDPQVLLVRRANEPFKGMWALPGGFVDARNDDGGERPRDAAVRELHEETGLEIKPAALWEVGFFADPGRDPRGRVVSFAFLLRLINIPEVVAGDDAAEFKWHPVELAVDSKLAFDHASIIDAAVSERVSWLTSVT